MFSGIIEALGKVEKVEKTGTNITFHVSSELSSSFKVDQSVSHNGVCLTVEKVYDNVHQVTAVQETLQKSNLGQLQKGDEVNIEKCITLQSFLDGHMVQGHVDCQAQLEEIDNKDGSYLLTLSYPQEFSHLVIEKGSCSINGISLTIFNLKENRFSVTIIPYTWEHTNLKNLKTGNSVNIEFDVVGKYIARLAETGKAKN